jgi:gamma-glutamyltranspeptidase/glutathione hydrolase
MVFGTMGGDQQDQWTSQFLLNRLIFGMDLQEAIEAPKVTSDHFPGTFHPHDAFPRTVCAEGRISPEVLAALRERGHDVKVIGDWMAGFICAVSRTGSGLLQAGADPRGRKASVFPSCALAW